MPSRPKSLIVRQTDKRRGTARERGYGKPWEVARLAYLKTQNFTCKKCGYVSRKKGDMHVDHIVPHRGDMELFWESENWQPLCFRCHSVKTGRGE